MKTQFVIIILVVVGIISFIIGYSVAPTDVATLRHSVSGNVSGGGHGDSGGYGADSGGYGGGYGAPAGGGGYGGGYGAPAAGGYGGGYGQ